MTTALRPELTPPPSRIARLPLDARGYPIPWFVDYVNGQPEFRAMDRRKWVLAIRDKRCWVCGGTLGKWLTFVIGPMCAISRTTGEPPCHDDCAEWAARNCPFLSRPRMVRREAGLPEDVQSAPGIALDRNPGVACLWTTTDYRLFRADQVAGAAAGTLITMGEPTMVRWFAEGRPATRAEVDASIASGYPALLALAEGDPDPAAVRELAAQRAQAERWLPLPA